MNNYVQKGDTLTLTAPYDVASGAGFQVGSIFAVAAYAATAGNSVEGKVTGVFDLLKVGSQAWTQGEKVYWDNAAKDVTATSAGNLLIGAAVLPVDAGASSTTGRVRLNGTVS